MYFVLGKKYKFGYLIAGYSKILREYKMKQKVWSQLTSDQGGIYG